MKTNELTTVGAVKDMMRSENLSFTTEEEWVELARHIEVHKYLINQTIPWTVSWDDAVFSWYDTVYRDLVRAIETWEVRSAFPQMRIGRLYLAVSTHWHYLKERHPEVTAEEAARNFAAIYGAGLGRLFSRFLQPAIS